MRVSERVGGELRWNRVGRRRHKRRKEKLEKINSKKNYKEQ